MNKYDLCNFILGDGVYTFGDVRLPSCPRIGESVVSRTYDHCCMWRVIMVQHMDGQDTRLIVMPATSFVTTQTYDNFKF